MYVHCPCLIYIQFLTVRCLNFGYKKKGAFSRPIFIWTSLIVSMYGTHSCLQVTTGTSPMENLVRDHVLVCLKPSVFSHDVTRQLEEPRSHHHEKGLRIGCCREYLNLKERNLLEGTENYKMRSFMNWIHVNIYSWVITLRTMWMGRVACVGDVWNVCRSWAWKSEEKGPLGKPRYMDW